MFSETMSFDSLASLYHGMEAVLAGGKLQRSRTALLDETSEPRSILLLGEGHGRCLLTCCRRFPHARIVCLDASAKMLTVARQHLERNKIDSSGVEFIHADVLHWTAPGAGFDLIVTNFFLDCFRPDQLEHIISNIAESTTVNANWLIADFQVAASGMKRLRSRLILWAMYTFFCTVTRIPAHKLTAPDLHLQRAGFILLRRQEFEWGLLHSDRWQRYT